MIEQSPLIQKASAKEQITREFTIKAPVALMIPNTPPRKRGTSKRQTP